MNLIKRLYKQWFCDHRYSPMRCVEESDLAVKTRKRCPKCRHVSREWVPKDKILEQIQASYFEEK